MAALVDQAASPHLADFVNAVGELIAAVLDRDLRVAVRQIAAIDVGDAHEFIRIEHSDQPDVPAP